MKIKADFTDTKNIRVSCKTGQLFKSVFVKGRRIVRVHPDKGETTLVLSRHVQGFF